jgi:hypothetical protein
LKKIENKTIKVKQCWTLVNQASLPSPFLQGPHLVLPGKPKRLGSNVFEKNQMMRRLMLSNSNHYGGWKIKL